ncbi:MAG: zf-TFIIB domain-containing protein [Myxococcaceae bacterium]|nr:zf-TFIIB domain-containing protein [Myxococcaceae bacterium]MCI0670377.1 zf-TFIIB domain-containing protein [Myxococcaceae bacterium]
MANIEKPSSNEEDFFAREEIEKKRKLALEQARMMEQREREERRKLHYMKCPKCGMDLQALEKGPVQLDTCFNCHGVWLDAGELEQMVNAGPEVNRTWMGSVLNLFRRK